jgi:outer membrane lipoprotein-sorting protein
MKTIIFISVLLLFPLTCFAETIVLKSGREIKGKIIEEKDNYIKVDFEGVPLTYYTEDIESISSEKEEMALEKQEKLSVAEIIEKAQRAAEEIQSFKADIESYILKDNVPVILRANLIFMRPKSSRMEAELYRSKKWGEGSKLDQIMVANDKVLWQYMPQAKMAAKLYLTAESSPLIGSELINPFYSTEINSLTLSDGKMVNGERCYVLKGRTRGIEKDSGRDNVVLWIDTNDYLLRKIKTNDESEDKVNSLSFVNIEKNITFDPQEFDFTPPDGTQIKEIR